MPANHLIVPTSKHFFRGQEAARNDYRKSSDVAPNDDLLRRMHPSFAAGYRQELRELKALAAPQSIPAYAS